MAICIGIDPGTHTGFAVWDTGSQAFLAVKTLPLHRALAEVSGYIGNGVALHVFVEDARKRRWFPREKSASEYRGRLMGAGAAKRDSAIWEEFLSDNGVVFTMHKPTAGGTKWDAEPFARFTGYKGRTSEHSRDAALLVYGRK